MNGNELANELARVALRFAVWIFLSGIVVCLFFLWLWPTVKTWIHLATGE
jgi:hypothetical protein